MVLYLSLHPSVGIMLGLICGIFLLLGFTVVLCMAKLTVTCLQAFIWPILFYTYTVF